MTKIVRCVPRILPQLLTVVLAALCALPAVSQTETNHAVPVKYTKHQRQAVGLWRVVEPPAPGWSVRWLAIYLGDSQNTMMVRWPTGLGCQYESAEMRDKILRIVGVRFPATIQFTGPKSATLSMVGRDSVRRLRKTKEPTDFLCE